MKCVGMVFVLIILGCVLSASLEAGKKSGQAGERRGSGRKARKHLAGGIVHHVLQRLEDESGIGKAAAEDLVAMLFHLGASSVSVTIDGELLQSAREKLIHFSTKLGGSKVRALLPVYSAIKDIIDEHGGSITLRSNFKRSIIAAHIAVNDGSDQLGAKPSQGAIADSDQERRRVDVGVGTDEDLLANNQYLSAQTSKVAIAGVSDGDIDEYLRGDMFDIS